MKNKKTITGWALSENIIPRTALYARTRLGIGERIGDYWLLTIEEWNQVKAEMVGKGNWERRKK